MATIIGNRILIEIEEAKYADNSSVGPSSSKTA